jgi:peptidoglycan/LPS O-acetylase OafA/YrhL
VNRDTSRLRLTGHLAGLDGVRGLAIVMVMAVHFVGDATPHTVGQRLLVKAASFGLLGVDLFFVLSGFLITGLLFDAKSRSHYFRNFYARRTLRIFPLYYLVLGALFVAWPLVVQPSPLLEQARAHQVWLWTYTANFYIAAKSSWAALTYVSHFWSLAIEEHFYLLWPLVVFSFRRETLERICVGVMVGGLALRIAAALAGMSELSISVLTPCRVDTLCCGGLLALLLRRGEGGEGLVRQSGRAALAIGATVVVLSAWCAATKIGLPVLHQLRNTLYALFFAALALTSLQPRDTILGTIFQSASLRFFGKYSYGLYVYHGIFTWYLYEVHAEDRLDAIVGNHALVIAARAALGVGVSVAVAVSSYHLFEKRFLALKSFFEARENGAPSRSPVQPPGPGLHADARDIAP